MGLPSFVVSSPRNKSEDEELRLIRFVDSILFLFFFRVYSLLYTCMLTTYCHNRDINHPKYLLRQEIYIHFSSKVYSLLARSALALSLAGHMQPITDDTSKR
jgi:hypothetical protein